MSQIGLPFEWAEDKGGRDFVVSDANAIAVRHLESWRDWPVMTSILSGPPRSGRSTLGRLFAAMSGGTVIDDAEGAGDEPLFHAWNAAQLERRPLLMIARHPSAQWTVALPDLKSRLAAAPQVRIEEPDDILVRTLLERGLTRAGTDWAPDLADWLGRRIERSYATVTGVIDSLNAASIAQARRMTVPFARETLQRAGFLPIVYTDSANDAGSKPEGS